MYKRIDYHIYYDTDFLTRDVIDKFMLKLKKKHRASVHSEEVELAQ